MNNPANLIFTTSEPNPGIDYVAHREAGKERKTPDYFAKLQGCKNGLKAWSTGTGATPELAVLDALQAWETEGK